MKNSFGTLTAGLALTFGLHACASTPTPAAQRVAVPAAAAPQPKAAAERTPPFSEDTAQKSPGGTATFMVPAGGSPVKDAEVVRMRS